MNEYARLIPLIAQCESMIALERIKTMGGIARIRRWKERIGGYNWLLKKGADPLAGKPHPVQETTFSTIKPKPEPGKKSRRAKR